MLKINRLTDNNNSRRVEAKQTQPFIVFTVNEEEFGIEVQKALELVEYAPPLRIANPFRNAEGIVHFRGKLIPLVDLRKMFGMEPLNYDKFATSIIVETNGITYGIIAERVLDLLLIPVASIKTISGFNWGEKTEYLKSVANLGERLVLLLDLDRILDFGETPTPAREALSTIPAENPEMQFEPLPEIEFNNGILAMAPNEVETAQGSESLPGEILEPEGLEEILSPPTVEQEGCLSGSAIEEILKELETETQSGLGIEHSPDIKESTPSLGQEKKPEEKLDV